MAGRILTYQVHPWECPTNYAAKVAMRCNVDVQDMRRVLPPSLWMPEAELEPNAREYADENWSHGEYPQRVAQFSLGAQTNWGFNIWARQNIHRMKSFCLQTGTNGTLLW